jgi:predicted O-methyltransferase YrrM
VSLRRRVAASPLAPLFAWPVRVRALLSEHVRLARLGWRWLRTSRETTNYNYDLTALSREHLAWFVASACDVKVADVRALFEELEADAALRAHVREATLASPYRRVSDPSPLYGRRLAWYAFVRLLRPSLVVETGTEKGLGTVVLAAALLRNGSGRLVTIDPVPDAGWLVSGPYAPVVTRRTGLAADVLRDLGETVDLFVHDVHHTASEEADEYAAVLPWLAPGAAIVNDNAGAHDALPRLAEERGWRYVHFHEQPAGHWYAGSDLAVARP